MRQVVAFLIRFSGLAFALREVFFRKKTTIIVYHNPTPQNFEKHLAYLSKHFSIISLQQLVDAITQKNWRIIPPKSLVITFDDGHANNYALLNALKEYQTPITIYACAGIVNTRRHFWFLDFPQQAQALKLYPNHRRLQKLAVAGYAPKKEFSTRQALTQAEMLAMQQRGVEFGSHTVFHPILTTCSNQEAQWEISESRKMLQTLLDAPVMHFAYPNGNYARREEEYLRQAGYHSARSTSPGWNDIKTNCYALKAMVISDDATVNEMLAQLSGIFPLFRRWVERRQ